MYKILGADQQEYGPASPALVRRWIAEGRLNAQTCVRADGTTDWRPIGEVPEFAEVFAPPAIAPSVPPPAAIPDLPLPLPAPAALPKTGLAIASLVLGVLALFCGGLLLGIPAIIIGHMAHRRARRTPQEYGGAGFAIAGFITGYCSVVATVLMLAVLLPALAQVRDKAEATECVSNLKQMGLAARMYANDHKDVFPLDFRSLSNELSTPKLLVCPKDTTRVPAANWQEFSSTNASYDYLLPNAKADAPQAVLFRCPLHGHRCLGDGSVQQEAGK